MLWNTFIKTIFVVVFLTTCLSSCIKILIPILLLTLEIATYICPWLKTFLGKYKPTKSRDRPCDLLIIIAYDTINENCLRFNLNGHSHCNGDISFYEYAWYCHVFFHQKFWLPTHGQPFLWLLILYHYTILLIDLYFS